MYPSRGLMHETPAGFTFLPGMENLGSHVFGVERAGRTFVCKRLPPRARGEDWMRARLLGEGRVLERLAGHGAPRLVASGEDGAGPFVVMERVDGSTIAERVEKAGPAAPAWIRAAAASGFRAMVTMHGLGVLHGDLSPTNVMATDDARVTFVDFGLAFGAAMPPMPPGPFRGTPAYAAPEAARGETYTRLTDLFGLAVTLLFAACGEPPRADAPEPALIVRAAEEPVEAWARRAAASLDPALARILVSACAFESRDRPDQLGAVPGVP